MGDKCDIILRRFTEDEVEGFVAAELMGNAALCQKIQAESGLDVQKIVSGAVQRLKADQAKAADAMLGINRLVSNQASNIAVDPVFVDSEAGPGGGGSGSGGGGGGSSSGGSGSGSSSGSTDNGSTDSGTTDDSTTTTPGAPQPTVVSAADGAEAVQTALNDPTVSQVTVKASEDGSVDSLSLSSISVPEGKTLIIESGVAAEIPAGETAVIEGTLTVNGTLTNNGTLSNEGKINIPEGSALVNNGTLTNDGKINGTVQVEDGTVTSTGGIIKEVDLNNGTLHFNGGSVEEMNLNGGALNTVGGSLNTVVIGENSYMGINGGSAQEIQVSGGYLEITGGTVPSITVDHPDSSVTIKTGTITELIQSAGTVNVDGGQVETAEVTGGTFNVNGATVDVLTVLDNAGNPVFNMNGGSVYQAEINGVCNIYDGRMDNYVLNDGTTNMYGGIIYYLEWTEGTFNLMEGDGAVYGGVEVKEENTFTMNGCLVQGGVWVYGSFQMNDGSVKGGVHLENGAEFIMEGGTVEGRGEMQGRSVETEVSSAALSATVGGDCLTPHILLEGGTIDTGRGKGIMLSGGAEAYVCSAMEIRGEVVVLTKDMSEDSQYLDATRYEEVEGTEPVELELNGYSLLLGALYVGNDYNLKIVDSTNSAQLLLSVGDTALENNGGTLRLENLLICEYQAEETETENEAVISIYGGALEVKDCDIRNLVAVSGQDCEISIDNSTIQYETI